MSSRFVRPIAVLGLMAVVLVGCGDDGAATTAATHAAAASTTSAGDPAEETPSLTLTVEGLTGYEGKVVVGSLSPVDGSGAGGSVCLPVDADPWTGSGVFSTSAPGNPCGKDAPYGEVITEAGEYTVSVGVYTPGETTPAVCFTSPATLFGPSGITVPAAAMVSNCTG